MLLELSRLLLGRQHLPLQPGIEVKTPRGSIYITIMELGPQNHNGDGLLGANSIIVVYMDPLGLFDVLPQFHK